MSPAEGKEEAQRGNGEPSRDSGPRDRPPASIAPPPISIDRVIGGRYRVVRSVGGGGMGHVFEVEHQALGRRFALKVLRVTGWDEELVQRFEREARALARIGSPRVAQVSDFGFEEGIGPWFVMELVAGRTLQDRLDETGAVGTEQGLKLAIALCEAVEDVHAEGIVHRDLKPANIGLPPGPIPLKLLDFGLAAGIDDELLTRITKSHQVLGSLPYIAPEQFAGSRPGKAQDLWAMGIVIYEMFTGRLPFEAPSTAALMHKILTAPPPAFDAFPETLRTVLGSLLVKDPKQRLASAAEAARLLRKVDAESLPDSLELALPDDGERESVDPLTPPFAITEAVSPPYAHGGTAGSGSGEAAHVFSAALSTPEEVAGSAEPTTPERAVLGNPRRGVWLALGLLALLVVGLVAYLALRPGPPVDDGPIEPVEVVPGAVEPVPEPTVEEAPTMEAATMEAESAEAESAEASMEAETIATPMERRRVTMRRRASSRRAAGMESTATMESETTMETMEEATMESSSWMGEIIGGGWGGEIIEGPQ